MSFVCESEMSEMKACLCRCTMWKAHQVLLNGKVEHLCPTIFQLTNLSQLMKCAADNMRNSCSCECAAQCVKTLKNMRTLSFSSVHNCRVNMALKLSCGSVCCRMLFMVKFVCVSQQKLEHIHVQWNMCCDTAMGSNCGSEDLCMELVFTRVQVAHFPHNVSSSI